MVSKVWRFEVERELASTPLGAIYQGKDPKSGKLVALRTIKLDAAGAQEFLAGLKQQAKAASTLNSPNIGSIYGGGTDAGLFFVALEFVPGISLRDLIARGQHFGTSEFIDLARQICSAIEHAHHRGIVHPALHPGNVMVEADGTAKLLDFGIPKDMPAEGDERRCYLAPEQLRGAAPELRSSLFSWAAILYELATGQKAFTGSDRDTLPRAPREITPSLPEGISKAIVKALQKDPADRYERICEFVAALESYKKTAQPVPPPAAAPVARPQAKPSAYAAMPPGPPPVAVQIPPPVIEVKPASPPPPLPPPPPIVEHVYGGPDAGGPTAQADAAHATPPAVKRAKEELKRKVHDAAATLRAPQTEMRVTRSLPYVAWGVAALAFLFLGLTGYHFIEGRVHASRVEAATVAATPTPEPPPAADVEVQTEQAVADPQAEPVLESSSPAAVATVKRAPPKAAVTRPVLRAVPITTGEVAINSIPDGASVQIDGRTDPNWRTPVVASSLPPGGHTIALTKAGYEPRYETVQVEVGRRTTYAATLNELVATIMVSSNPAGAEIFVDGKDTGRDTPTKLVLAKGTHTFVLRRPGFFEFTSEAQLFAGQTSQIKGQLKMMGNVDEAKSPGKLSKFLSRAKAMGRLQIKTMPKGGRVVINGRTMDKTTPAEFLLPAGNYEVVVTVAGYQPLRRMVSLDADSRTVIDEPLLR